MVTLYPSYRYSVLTNVKRLFAVMLITIGFVWSNTALAAPQDVQCRVELDRAILPAGRSQTAIVKVSLDAPPPPQRIQRPAVNLGIVLDRSGSMSGQKLEKAKQAAVEAFRHLSNRDIFSLVVYDHNIQTVVPAQPAGFNEGVERQIRAIYAGGNTALFGGVSQGAAEIRKNSGPGYIHRIILLSDGLANVGPSSPDDLGRLGTALIKENISVTTIGVGTDYNEDLMTRLAQNSDGNSYFVESSRDLPRIFTAELGDVLNVVARRIQLTIECQDGVRPLGLINRQGKIRGQNVELYLNQLYGSQQKFALLEVEITGSASGAYREIARARVSYEDPFSRRQKSAVGQVAATFSSDTSTVRHSVNRSVYRDYQLNLNARAQEEAIRLSDEGRKKDAVDALKSSASKLRQVAEAFDDDELMKEADKTEAQAATVEKKGMTKKQRKVLRTESYQMKTQQMTE